MELSQIEKGMWLSCEQGIGKVLVVDQQMQTVLLEDRATQQQFAAEASELYEEPQLHSGCDKYC